VNEIGVDGLFRHYIKHWRLMLVLFITGLALGLGYSLLLQKPLYRSDSSVLIESATSGDMVNYIEIAKSRRVLEEVIRGSGLDAKYQDLYNGIELKNQNSTQILHLSLSYIDAAKSRTALGEWISSLKNEIDRVYAKTGLNIKIIDEPSLPLEPYNVNLAKQLALPSGAGLIIAFVILYIMCDYRVGQRLDEVGSVPDKTNITTGPEPVKQPIVNSTTIIPGQYLRRPQSINRLPSASSPSRSSSQIDSDGWSADEIDMLIDDMSKKPGSGQLTRKFDSQPSTKLPLGKYVNGKRI